MSDEQTASPSEPQESKPRQGRSPVEKVIWLIIVCVIAGLGLELYAKTSYEDSMAALDETFSAEGAAEQRLSEVRNHLAGLTTFAAAVPVEGSSVQEEIKVSWISPTGKYEVTLVVEKGGDDPIVAWYKMGADNWVSDPYDQKNWDTTPVDGGMPATDPMAGGPMGTGGPTAGHDADASMDGPPGQEGSAGRGEDGQGDGGRSQGPTADDSPDADSTDSEKASTDGSATE
ncbi:MAG: hypothetical protein ACYTGL_01960 [Planctomycetota bacterium]|jgi:hypothetical protein